MTEPTQSDARAVSALMELVERVEQAEKRSAETNDGAYRINTWFALRLLIEAIPPDQRLQAIDQAMQFAVPDIVRDPDFVASVEQWTAPDADAFLTRITDMARGRARAVLDNDPARAAIFHSHLARTGAEDLLSTHD